MSFASSMRFDDKERETLRSLGMSADVSFTRASLNNGMTRKDIISCVSDFFLSQALQLDMGDDSFGEKLQTAAKSKENASAVIFARSMATAVVVGYFQAFNNDVAIKEEDVPEFGFDGLADVFRPALAATLDEMISVEKSVEALESGLCIKLRSCSADEYFTGKLYHSDVAVLGRLIGAHINDGYNVHILDELHQNSNVVTNIGQYLKVIKGVYDILLEDSFGIEQYAGVMVSDTSCVTMSRKESVPRTIEACDLVLSKLTSRMYQKMAGVKISQARQFDYDEIFTSTEDVVFFPYKIMEYVYGRESSLNTLMPRYKSHACGATWSKYYSQYIAENMENILYRGMYKAYERLLISNGTISSSFISREFVVKTSDYKAFVSDTLKPVFESVLSMVDKLVRSVTCAYLVTKWKVVGIELAGIRVRVSVTNSAGGFDCSNGCSSDLFLCLTGNNTSEVFESPISLTEGKKAGGQPISSKIYEYQYEVNPDLAAKEPLFGYTVQLLNQDKGVSAGWDNILLGQSKSGKELYSSLSVDADIRIQPYLIHNIYAGSRAGKGVMTMNLLANALAAGKPVFYLDRKPDMANMLYALSGGRQFIINGGAYDADKDPGGYFNENGPFLRVWHESPYARKYLEQNPEIARLLGITGNPIYAMQDSKIADYLYLRAFIFCLGLIALRASGDVPDNVKAELNGNGGIVIVVDELNNVQSKLAELFASDTSPLTQEAKKLGDLDEFAKNLEKKRALLSDKRSELEAELQKEKQNLKTINKYRREIHDLEDLIRTLMTPTSAYAATVFSKLVEGYKFVEGLHNAGWRETEYGKSDIFVLGQNINASYYSVGLALPPNQKGAMSSRFFPLDSTGNIRTFYKDKGDVIRSFLECLESQDWFFGRVTPNYADHPRDTVSRDWVGSGNWQYILAPDTNVVGFSANAMAGAGGESLVPGTFRSILFKPYLVLNESAESGPVPKEGDSDTRKRTSAGWLMTDKWQYVSQCVDRTGLELWKSVRKAHLRDPNVTGYGENSLHDGIGFRGLVRETLKTTVVDGNTIPEDIDSYIADVLAKSGIIADNVAKVMGYPGGWLELLFDFRPEGLFSVKDMLNAFINPAEFSREARLPIFAGMGLLGDDSPDPTGGGNETEGGYGENMDSLFDSMESQDSVGDETADYAFSGVQDEPQQNNTPVMNTRTVAQQMWGTPEEDDEPEERTYSQTEQLHQSSSTQSSASVLNALWSQAMMLAQTAVALDPTGYKYTDDDIDIVAQTAFGLLKEFAGVS